MNKQSRKYVSLEALETLGRAMRAARSFHEPPLRLVDIGESPKAPRSWSDSHLSKVERGKEVPGLDLVLWYEQRTQVTSGSLISLWEQATGLKYQPNSAESKEEAPWVIERLEMYLDLRPTEPLLTHTRDLLSNKQNDSYWIMYDTKDVVMKGADSDVVVEVGGEIVERQRVENSTVEKARISLGRVVQRGGWHHLRVTHRLPSRDTPPFLDFSLRTPGVRDVQLIVHFPAGSRPRVLRFTHAYSADLAELIANPFVITNPEPQREELSLDEFGLALTRFPFPEAGFHHGLVWSEI